MSTETPDLDLLSAVRAFFGAHDNSAVTAEETGEFPSKLWSEADDLGFTTVGLPDGAGDVSGSMVDVATVLMGASSFAAPLPLVEHWLAGWVLTEAGVDIPKTAPVVLAPSGSATTMTLRDGKLHGTLARVSWARAARWIVALVDDEGGRTNVVAIDPGDCEITRGTDITGQPCDNVRVDTAPIRCAPSPINRNALASRGALLRAAQIAGALRAVDELTRRYVAEREQFGRPIGRYQAVQIHTVAIAQAYEITTMSVWRAAVACGRQSGSFEALCAKAVANEQARIAARATHQAHGAMGMTREYPLHTYTRRLAAWGHDYGTEIELHHAIGASAAAQQSFGQLISATEIDAVIDFDLEPA